MGKITRYCLGHATYITRKYLRLLTVIIAVLPITGCSHKRDNGATNMDKQTILNEVNVLGGKRIFFGHQSVGENILGGLSKLFTDEGIEGLNIVNVEKSAAPAGPLLAETRIGKNGDPKGKCDAFESRVIGFPGGPPDIAVLKFCFVDFKPETDVRALFAYYETMVDTLRAKAPVTKLVHVTVPLTIRTPAWKKLLKRVLGREESSDTLNTLRCEFNDLLRARYAGEPLLDIAAIESTYPGGAREEFVRGGKTVFALRPDLSSDGVHLNGEGSRLAAAEFLRVLAGAASGASR